jgi:hypothetical protein
MSPAPAIPCVKEEEKERRAKSEGDKPVANNVLGVGVEGLAGEELPQDNTKGVNVGLFIVIRTLYHTSGALGQQ